VTFSDSVSYVFRIYVETTPTFHSNLNTDECYVWNATLHNAGEADFSEQYMGQNVK
jgi:hypothetical protein